MQPPRRTFWHRLPLLALGLAAGIGLWRFPDLLTLQTIADHRQALQQAAAAHPWAAPLAYVLAYAGLVALSIPGAVFATLLGGLLFGLIPGTACTVTGATLGACLVFLAARAGIGAEIAQRIDASEGPARRLLTTLRANQTSALLTMRLIPVIPFFLANLLPAFAGVRLLPYALTTFVGIFPASLVYTSLGAGLGELLDRRQEPDLALILSPQVLVPLLCLAVLAALPLLTTLVKGRADADT